MDGFREAWEAAEQANRAYVETLAPWAIAWVAVMGRSIQLSLLFVLWRWEARWVLLSGLLTGPVSVLLRIAMGEGYPPGFNHVVLWTPLVIYLWIRWWRYWPGREFDQAPGGTRRASGMAGLYWRIYESRIFRLLFGIWLTVMTAILTVSLIFDYHEALSSLLTKSVAGDSMAVE